MSSWSTAQLDDIAAEQWPYWAPIRHHFGITTFGINAWRGADGDEVIKRHDESDSRSPELYLVLSGSATFTIGEDDVEAREGTLVYVSDPTVERVAFAKADGTVVLSIGAGAAGEGFGHSGWDANYLESAP